MAVEKRYNDAAQALVAKSWEHIKDLLEKGSTQLQGGMEIQLTNSGCIDLFKWLASFQPPKGGATPVPTNFQLRETTGDQKS